jgi:hypothetical protein
MDIFNLISSIPEPFKLSAVAFLSFFGKQFVDWYRNRPKEKRDDFKALTEVMTEELKRLTDRVEIAEKKLENSKAETESCEAKYKELIEKYAEVIASNLKLQEEVNKLRLRIERTESLEKLFIK